MSFLFLSFLNKERCILFMHRSYTSLIISSDLVLYSQPLLLVWCESSCRNRTVCMTGFPSARSVHPPCWRGTILAPNLIWGKHRSYSCNYPLRQEIPTLSIMKPVVLEYSNISNIRKALTLMTESHLFFCENSFLCTEAVFWHRPRRETGAGGDMNYKQWLGSGSSLSS